MATSLCLVVLIERRSQPWPIKSPPKHYFMEGILFIFNYFFYMSTFPTIIDTSIGGEDIKAVNARDLWNFLEVWDKFSDWIKPRIEDFILDIDYQSLSVVPENGGRQIDYILSIDMAKNIAMMQKNEKGKEVRKYFIECERKLKSLSKEPISITPSMLRLMAEGMEKLEQEKQIETHRRFQNMGWKGWMAKSRNYYKERVEELAIRLDESKDYATIKKVWYGNWRKLKCTVSIEKYPPIDVFDANYWSVKAYHANVWKEAYWVAI